MWQIEVTLRSDDVDATDTLLAGGLGLSLLEPGRYLAGTMVVSVVDAGPEGRSGVGSLAMRGGHVAAAAAALGRAGYPVEETAQALTSSVEGVELLLMSERIELPVVREGSSSLDGKARSVDHIGIASDSSARLSTTLTELGWVYESRQVDSQTLVSLEVFSSDRYGVVNHASPPQAAGALLVSFLRHGTVDIEILEDIMPTTHRPGSGPGSTTGDNRAIAHYVARRGPGLHHLAFRVDDVDRSVARLTGAGVSMIDQQGRPGSRRSRIAFVDRRSTGGIVAHLVERQDDD